MLVHGRWENGASSGLLLKQKEPRHVGAQPAAGASFQRLGSAGALLVLPKPCTNGGGGD